MQLPVAIATLFLAATTALPAFAATSIVNAPNGIPTASVDTVRYRYDFLKAETGVRFP